MNKKYENLNFTQVFPLLSEGCKAGRPWLTWSYLKVENNVLYICSKANAVSPKPFRLNWDDLAAGDWFVYEESA